MVELRDAHQVLVRDGRHFRSNGAQRAARTASDSDLGLSTSATPTTLRSVEEVNTTPTSYSPSHPEFEGSSSSSPFVGGVYSGANGDDTLTVTATFGGVVGLTPITLEVTDGQGGVVDTVNMGFSPAGTVFTLSNGLELSFSSGSIQAGDSFEIDVSQSVGSAANADNPFDGAGDFGAGFESGFGVGDGSFDVNGVSISVSESDTLNDVLNRITASAAGVTASFDAATETVLLTQKTAGPSEDIVLANDTSGLLAAIKLDSAVAVAGGQDETDTVISQVAALSGIQSGTFLVNGQTLTVDVLVDSLSDVIDRINGSGAGASAAFDTNQGKFSIQSTGGDTLEVGDGTSNLFSALDIAAGTFERDNESSRTRFEDPKALRRNLLEFARVYKKVFEGTYTGFGTGTVKSMRGQLDKLVSEAFDEILEKSGSGTLRSGLGIDFSGGDGSYRALEIDSTRLGRTLDRDAEALAEFLFSEEGEDGVDGLLTALGDRLDQMMGSLKLVLGPDAVGLGLNVSA